MFIPKTKKLIKDLNHYFNFNYNQKKKKKLNNSHLCFGIYKGVTLNDFLNKIK